MKPKTIITLVVIAALVVSAFFALRSCGIDARYKKMKADYEFSVRLSDEANAVSRRIIADLEAENAGKDEKIAQYVEEVSTISAKLTVVSARVEELQANEPVQPELESEPLVINLRGQISSLTEMLSLSQEALTTQTLISDTLRGKVTNLEAMVDEWAGMYEREHLLRVQSEGLFKEADRKIRGYRLRGKVATVLTVAGAIVIGSQLLR